MDSSDTLLSSIMTAVGIIIASIAVIAGIVGVTDGIKTGEVLKIIFNGILIILPTIFVVCSIKSIKKDASFLRNGTRVVAIVTEHRDTGRTFMDEECGGRTRIINLIAKPIDPSIKTVEMEVDQYFADKYPVNSKVCLIVDTLSKRVIIDKQGTEELQKKGD